MFCPRVLTFVLTLAAIGCGGDDDDSVGDGDADSDSDADSAPRELHRFFDDVAIATTRIGCD